MKTAHIKFAVISCTFILGACGGQVDTDESSSLDGVSGSTYSQSLTPDGDIDCASLHHELERHGIDPALLEPETVENACIDSNDVPADTCHQVAYGCFGPNANCGDSGDDGEASDPDESSDGTSQICQAAYDELAQANVDPDGVTSEMAEQLCLDNGYEDQLCRQVASECFAPGSPDDEGNAGDPGTGEDGDTTSPLCQAAYDELAQSNIDPDSVTSETAEQLCLDNGYDGQICQQIAQECFESGNSSNPDDGNTGANDVDCASIEQSLADQGYQTPLGQDEAMIFYDECLQRYEEQWCQEALQCVTN